MVYCKAYFKMPKPDIDDKRKRWIREFRKDCAMPIYEFKCLKCDEFFEILFRGRDEEIETLCPKCGSEEFERVISSTNFAMGESGGGKAGAKATTRNCASGSCTTYEIPGPGN
jgi:putative FmdB family regulatory protein